MSPNTNKLLCFHVIMKYINNYLVDVSVCVCEILLTKLPLFEN